MSTPRSAREAAFEALIAVCDRGETFDTARARIDRELAGRPEEARLAVRLAETVLRHRGLIDRWLNHCMPKPLRGRTQEVLHLLRLGVAQLQFLATAPHAAINETVSLVKQRGHTVQAGMANAILRRTQREGAAWFAEQPPVALLPDWVAGRWQTAWGEAQASAMAAMMVQEPPIDLSFGGSRPEGLEGDLLPTGQLRLTKRGDVAALPGYADGAFWVQDMAASLPVRLLGEVKGMRVADLCAAPGGKAAQLSAMGAEVVAVDRSARRMRRFAENMQRLGFTPEAVIADLLDWEPGEAFDALLLDAPCSATGTWRRHPELLWRLKEADITELAALQAGLLHRASHWVRSGGRLVYAVCSLEREEGEAQLENFLKAHSDWSVVPPEGEWWHSLPEVIHPQGWLRCLPVHRAEVGGMDGFFAVCLQRR